MLYHFLQRIHFQSGGSMSVHIRKRLDESGIRTARPIGKEFVFTAAHGSHRHELWGTITGLSWSDEGDLQLFVSVPEFWGKELHCLVYGSGGWSAYIAFDQEEMAKEIAALPETHDEQERMKVDRIAQQYHERSFFRGKLTILDT
jgi:hypothetical protein